MVQSAGELPDPQIYNNCDTLKVWEEPRNISGNVEIWICREIRRNVAEAPEQYPIFSPNADVIWPGAALQGGSISCPTPDRIIAKRGSGNVIISNLTGTFHSSEFIPEVRMSTVFDAANKIIASQPENFPANMFISIERIKTKEELALSLHANSSFFGLFSASASFDYNEDDTYTRFLVTLNQSFYTLLFERPSRIDDFFAADVTAEDLKPFVGEGNPPVYISSVNYGRIFYLLIESTEEANSMSGAISLDFLFGGVGGSYKHVYQLKNLRIQAFALGGDKDQALSAVFGGLGQLQSFLQSLKAGGQIKSAMPLSYVVRSVRSDKLVKNGVATEYVIREATPTGNNLSAPTPLKPIDGEVVDNGSSFKNDPITWQFEWLKCPTASKYNLVVFNPKGDIFLDITTTSDNYTLNLTTPISSLSNWSWMIRAKYNGVWGGWSRTVIFKVEPINTDCPPRIIVYQHSNYNGRYLTFSGSCTNLDSYGFNDCVSSVKFENIRGVTLYVHINYQGGFLYLNQNCSNLDTAPYWFNDVTSSFKIDKW